MSGYLPHHLSRLMNIMNLHLLDVLRPLDLTVAQFRVLQILDCRSPSNIGEIARDIVMEHSVVSRVVGQLEERSCVTRIKRPGNARIVDIHLTKTGQETYAKLRPPALAIVDYATSVLNRGEKDVLLELLKRMFNHTASPRYPWLDKGRVRSTDLAAPRDKPARKSAD